MNENYNEFLSFDDLDEEIFYALHSDCDHDIEESNSLLNASQLIAKFEEQESPRKAISFFVTEENPTEDLLRRAARNGKPIAPEVEERMRLDRKEAEGDE